LNKKHPNKKNIASQNPSKTLHFLQYINKLLYCKITNKKISYEEEK